MAWLFRLREAITRIFRIGTQGSMDPRHAKRIILANQIALSLGILCLLHVYIDHAMGAYILGWLNIPIALGYFAILLLNRAGLTWLARFALVTYASTDILIYALALGKPAGMHLFFLPACWAPLVLFGWEERKSLIYGILLSSLMLIGCEIWGSTSGLLHNLAPEVVGRMHSDTLITTLLIQILMAAYFFFGNRRVETDLAQALETAKAADSAKSRFLANMSHEIRTPMNGILGITNQLIKSGLSPDKVEMAQTIQSSSLDLMTIINEILDLSKIEAGKMQLESRPFGIRKEVASVLRLFEYDAGRRGLTLALDIDPAVPPRVAGDSNRLKQILRNLVGNALKFTHRGGVTLRIRPGMREEFLDCEVEDTGLGIPEAARGRIFQSFSQADESTTRKYGGTGLGLSISRQIVELMGGSIGFHGRVGGGTVFCFTAPFPAASPDEASPESEGGAGYTGTGEAETAASRGTPARDASGLRILVVDDHPINRMVLQGMLGEFNAQPVMAGSGKEALDACDRRDYDLVLMDCHMPDIDGLECTRQLRNRLAAGARPAMTIVGVTADVMPGSRERCLAAGMDDVLSKPILGNELERILSRFHSVGRVATTAEPSSGAGKVPDAGWVDADRLAGMSNTFRHREPDFWEGMMRTFQADVEAQIRATRDSLERRDLAAAGEALHALKALCRTVGFSRMADICSSLERSVSEGDASGWTGAVLELETALGPSLEEARKVAGGP